MFRESFHIAFAEGRRLAAFDAITPAALDGEILLVRRGCALTIALRDRCAEAGIKLQHHHVFENEEHLQQLVASGFGSRWCRNTYR